MLQLFTQIVKIFQFLKKILIESLFSVFHSQKAAIEAQRHMSFYIFIVLAYILLPK